MIRYANLDIDARCQKRKVRPVMIDGNSKQFGALQVSLNRCRNDIIKAYSPTSRNFINGRLYNTISDRKLSSSITRPHRQRSINQSRPHSSLAAMTKKSSDGAEQVENSFLINLQKQHEASSKSVPDCIQRSPYICRRNSAACPSNVRRSGLLDRRQSMPENLIIHSRPRNESSSREIEGRRTSRRSSEATRNRSLIRTFNLDRRNSVYSNINDLDKNRSFRTSRIPETSKEQVQVSRLKRDKKSTKSTEGSSRKSTKREEETAVDEAEDTNTMDETDQLYRRISAWVTIVDKHMAANDFDKCVVMDEIDYKDDIPRPSSNSEHYHSGNHHTVTIVQYDDG